MPESATPPLQFGRKLAAGSVRGFHAYAFWLVSIRWRRFWFYALLLLVASGIAGDLLPTHSVTDWVEIKRAKPPKAPRSSASDPPSIPSSNTTAVPPSVIASAPGTGSVEIRLPPGATGEAVKAAVAEARQAIVEALEAAHQPGGEVSRDAGDATQAAEVGRRLRTRQVSPDNPFPSLALLFIIASAVLKGSYKGRLQAEVKAAVATENAESEQLKRQVIEARMAAMQAQVEPHFLFNTLASIDHLIETDPVRASRMQKNLIALLRASMPTLREGHPAAHDLGREMAMIRPYLEILKVRMEDRLQTVIDVPDGLLSADFPPMAIQGLVENAIKHGLEPKPEGGSLSVRAEVTDGRLVVTVADTGLGFGCGATTGTGVGLVNLRERLQLLYGGAGTLTIAENPPSGTRVSVTLPYRFKVPDEAR